MGSGTVVEFTGIPGAGKSYLAMRLTELLIAGGRAATAIARPALTPARQVALVASILLRRPRFAVSTAGILGKQGPRGFRVRWRLWINWMIAQALVEEGRRRPGVTVLDQGPVQLLSSIGLRETSTVLAECAAVIRETTGSDLLVEVSVPIGLAEERLLKRRSPRPSGDELEQGRTVLEAVLSSLAGHGKRVMVTNDGSLAVERALAPVLEALYLPGTPPGS